MAQSGRLKSLDALRGVAVSAVLLFHFLHQFPKLFGHAPVAWDSVVVFGGYGVDLFFIISGFVIFMTLERSPGVLSFLRARAKRLYPTYWVAMTLTFFATTLGAVETLRVSATAFAANWTMVPQLLGQAPVDGAYWSLAAEWGFYVTVCALYFAGALRKPLLGLAAWLAVAVVIQLALPFLPADSSVTKLVRFADMALAGRYIHLFILGMTFFHAWRTRRVGPGHALLIAAAVARQTFNEGWAVGLLTSGFAAVFLAIAKDRLAWLARSRVLLFFGEVSFSLYLVHQHIGYLIMESLSRGGAPFGAAVTVALAGTIGLAFVLHRLVEKPVGQLWARSKSPVAQAVGAAN